MENPSLSSLLNSNNYDFIDFGCSNGGSIVMAQKVFSGGRGLGLDKDPEKVKKAQQAGYEAVVADVTKLSHFQNKVRFVVMSHFLEHLPGHHLAKLCIESACKISRDFIYIQQPYFDADSYLFQHDLKLYWSDWHGHLYHMTSLNFYKILHFLLEKGQVKRFSFYGYKPIKNSESPAVHPINSKMDRHDWSPTKDPPKPKKMFDYDVFSEMRVLIILRDFDESNELENLFNWDKKLFDSRQDGE